MKEAAILARTKKHKKPLHNSDNVHPGKYPGPKPIQPQASTSWEPLADWYEAWAGELGSQYHQTLAIPTVLELLRPLQGETILDVGCGTGVLSSHLVQAGVTYVGVDASPRMLTYAKQRANVPSITGGRQAGRKLRTRRPIAPRFLLGDAAQLSDIPGIESESFDAAVFMLSLQDMEPLDKVLQATANTLKRRSRIVLLLTHPCFRTPRQSGWGWDEGRKLQYRRIDRYLTPMAVPVRPIFQGRSGAIHSFHRPLQDYVNALNRYGFMVDRIVEVPAYPHIQRRGPRAKAQNAANREIPVFLGISAQRLAK